MSCHWGVFVKSDALDNAQYLAVRVAAVPMYYALILWYRWQCGNPLCQFR